MSNHLRIVGVNNKIIDALLDYVIKESGSSVNFATLLPERQKLINLRTEKEALMRHTLTMKIGDEE